jgi:hypothetical protein
MQCPFASAFNYVQTIEIAEWSVVVYTSDSFTSSCRETEHEKLSAFFNRLWMIVNASMRI